MRIITVRTGPSLSPWLFEIVCCYHRINPPSITHEVGFQQHARSRGYNFPCNHSIMLYDEVILPDLGEIVASSSANTFRAGIKLAIVGDSCGKLKDSHSQKILTE
jgi:hypothetical protein